MATKNAEALKAAKQKKILIVLGVGLLAVGGIQVPRLMGGNDTPAAAEASATDATTTDATTTTDASAAATATPTIPVVASTQTTALLPGEADKRTAKATLVGVDIPSGTTVRVAQGQLASFSLFKPKDPFKPQVTDKPAGGSDATAAVQAPAPVTKPDTPAVPEPTPTPEPTTPSTTQPTTAGNATPLTPEQTTPAEPVTPVEPPKYATISVNGLAESLEVGTTFPKSEPLFVLTKVKPKLVRIGIAGGKLEKGATALVEVGSSITLVDSASGVRYVVKVISVGATPDLAFTSMTTAANGQVVAQPTATDAAGATATTSPAP
jgi:hypothetical protein